MNYTMNKGNREVARAEEANECCHSIDKQDPLVSTVWKITWSQMPKGVN